MRLFRGVLLSFLWVVPAYAGGLAVGKEVPDWELPGVDGQYHALHRSPGKKGSVMLFWSNRAPQCRGYDQTVVALANEYQKRGFAFIAINSCDYIDNSAESFDAMKSLAQRCQYPFPYVLDLNQQVAHEYGVKGMPTAVVVDENRRLLYFGGVDEKPQRGAKPVDTTYLGATLKAFLEGQPLKYHDTPFINTAMKWNPRLRPVVARGTPQIGSFMQVPAIALMDTRGTFHVIRSPLRSIYTVLVFTSNACPDALAYEDRLAEIVKKTGNTGGTEFFVINSHDANRESKESFKAMQARAEQKNYPFPYLYDSTQSTARAFGVTSTPHVFVLDRLGAIRYHGSIDDNVDASKVTRHYLIDALENIARGNAAEPALTTPSGCEIQMSQTAPH